MPDAELVRAFVAVLPPEAVARELERLLTHLRTMARLRWASRDQLHITLRFLGERPRPLLERAGETLRRLSVTPFEVTLSRAGGFPNLSRPRTLWLGGETGEAELADLARRVDDALFGLGIERETRPFRSHLTLARHRGEPLPSSLLEELRRVPAFSWTCSEIALMRSQLTPRGAVYTRLA